MIKIDHALIVSTLAIFSIFYVCNNLLNKAWEENTALREQLFHLEDKFTSIRNCYEEHNVTVTMYNPTRGQTDRTPNITADGTRINPDRASEYRYIALSRDLLSRWGGPFDYGDYVVIEGTEHYDGVYQVRDTMNPRFTKRVDILKTRGSKLFKYTNITLYKYDSYENKEIALINE